MCPSPSEHTVTMAVSAPTTESRYEYPSDDDVEIGDSIADETMFLHPFHQIVVVMNVFFCHTDLCHIDSRFLCSL